MKTLTAISLFSALLTTNAIADDCQFIRDAYANLPASGGTVHIPAGDYVCSTAIVLDKSHTALIANNDVVLHLADHANAPLIVMGDALSPPQPTQDIQVSGLSLDGNKDNQDSECWGGACDRGPFAAVRNNGISIRALSDGKVSQVEIARARSGGLVTELGTTNLSVDNVVATENYYDGIAGCQTSGSRYAHILSIGNNSAGLSFDIDFDNNVITDALLIGNHDVGVFMRHSSGNLFAQVDVQGAGSYGVFLAAGYPAGSCVTNNEFRDLKVDSVSHAGFRLNDACSGNTLTGTTAVSHVSADAGEAHGDLCVSVADGASVSTQGTLNCNP